MRRTMLYVRPASAFTAQPGTYRAWLRIGRHQKSETKEAFINGKRTGAIHSEPNGKGYTEFRPVPGTVNLSAERHTLRIICRGICGWIDPIHWVYLTSDLDLAPRLCQRPHAPILPPRKPGAAP